MTRDALNAKAEAVGVENPERLPNKRAVQAAIDATKPQTLDLTVAGSVEDDLRLIAQREPILARSGRAASALALAREMDTPNSATSKSMCARALNETLAELHDLAPAAKKKDRVDEIGARRAQRREGKSATTG